MTLEEIKEMKWAFHMKMWNRYCSFWPWYLGKRDNEILKIIVLKAKWLNEETYKSIVGDIRKGNSENLEYSIK
jgi:hypothetical protein